MLSKRNSKREGDRAESEKLAKKIVEMFKQYLDFMASDNHIYAYKTARTKQIIIDFNNTLQTFTRE